ncbi:MAG: phosphoribosylformylglycinamidine synthase [Lachnospiraceae bacterium]|nr:phosphoribosylformylglycinamidine synthase [Lachnospiraceae bacterium]
MSVRRVYVEKKPEYAVRASQLLYEIKTYLGISGLTGLRELIRYDAEGISEDIYKKACTSVFSEPPVDILYEEDVPIPEGARVFSSEYLPGQYDQRADSAEQCIRFLRGAEEPLIRTAVTYILLGDITDEEFKKIEDYCINPVDSRVAAEEKPDTIKSTYPEPGDVKTIDGFTALDDRGVRDLCADMGLAMTVKDLLFVRDHFRDVEHRDPTVTEIRVLDTYWSDHCRHTTFSTEITEVTFDEGFFSDPIRTSYQSYLDTREELYGDDTDRKPSLMDLALIGMKKLKAEGRLNDLEESEENNACTVVVNIDVDRGEGRETEEWLLFFKNETHNHPTEIEPFGGAATCLGGAIRDPLSGRGYVYQAMRVTGASDPTVPDSETLPGKLSQKRLVRGAAKGYSSYGNQIGLATGYVNEIYHPGYKAKRMEIGAVMGAAPRKNVKRLSPEPGDNIILLGGRTGRDGIGGATGSSKAHNERSIETCGAEVQKGNALTERKLQRLFRRPEVSSVIKKCNDFGAGGVAVAIGELADGIEADLDLVPKKYEGLDGTELAISESQERMAVVVSPEDTGFFLEKANEENLEATVVARVTEEKRLVLKWRGRRITDISRAFLSTNGARQETPVHVQIPPEEGNYIKCIASGKASEALERGDLKSAWLGALSELNVCSEKGLVEMFDSTIGASSVLMPYGGKTQLTPAQVMAAKLPVSGGSTDASSVMAYGFDPYLSDWSPYHGAIYAVTESLARLVSSGCSLDGIHFTFQEYFKRMNNDPVRFSAPFTALLGAYDAQVGYGLASVGGKDSMSGSFNDIDVPPTLVSFAVDMADASKIVTPELKKPGSRLVLISINKDDYDIPVYRDVLETYRTMYSLMYSGRVLSAYAPDAYGIAPALAKMAFGNGLGVSLDPEKLDPEDLFSFATGDLILEMDQADLEGLDAEELDITDIGSVTEEPVLRYGGNDGSPAVEISLSEAERAWSEPLSRIFPAVAEGKGEVDDRVFSAGVMPECRFRTSAPSVFIPVMPGTNCEYDSAAAFEKAGAKTRTEVFINLTSSDMDESVRRYVEAIDSSQIIMFPGGFSAGDEPDGSAKFFATAFENMYIKEAVMRLLDERDGLILGICNGFQALIKLGLVPEGRITGQTPESPTLTYNTIGRHISKMAYIRTVSNKSPWLSLAEPGAVYANPASHGEGRFVAPPEVIKRLEDNGQIATRYCDPAGRVSMDGNYNINGSYGAIEGILSPDGRVFGKMTHSERIGENVQKNIFGNQDLRLFEAGVRYFRL